MQSAAFSAMMLPNESAIYTFTMSSSCWRRCWNSSNSTPAVAVKKAKEQAAKFSPKRLKNIVDKLARYDFKFKSGALSLDNAFYEGVLSVMCDA